MMQKDSALHNSFLFFFRQKKLVTRGNQLLEEQMPFLS